MEQSVVRLCRRRVQRRTVRQSILGFVTASDISRPEVVNETVNFWGSGPLWQDALVKSTSQGAGHSASKIGTALSNLPCHPAALQILFEDRLLVKESPTRDWQVVQVVQVVEVSKQTKYVNQCSTQDHDVQDLMTATEDVELAPPESLGELARGRQ